MQNPVADPIDILIEDDRWAGINLALLCERAFANTLGEFDLPLASYEFSVLACDDKRIATLNADFRGKESATNVLSWPTHDLAPSHPGEQPQTPPSPKGPFPAELGDIAISFDTCAAEAAAGSVKFEDHVTHLLVHSCLHLLGFDHETDADAARMEGLETKILETLQIADPY